MLVGSCYRRNERRTRQVIEAPASLASEEMKRFAQHLESLGITIQDRDRPLIQKDNTFLSALYRLLPESRGPLVGA